ncbi:type II secretion system F family protein [Pararhodobacter aggregans]|uniref:Pilus assembly protein TadB n=1 Tax=Pararhodobacter aggregans TaxID=404875 RepID=A0A2T7UJW4_9RHOB|nr:type II secretion system F family protein [Pararhodobacter aggregans]PTW98940.1 tight adherence protein B [Pararhodobacter aggregans]PVE44971.1 pilus assembly protein TadB [Pararhodobacter aggregans]
MSISPTVIIYIAIFAGILLLVEAIYLLAFGRSIRLGSRMNRRLEMLDANANRTEVIERLRKEATQHSKSTAIPFYSLLAEKAEKGKIAFSPSMLIVMMLLLAVVVFLAMTVLTAAPLGVRAGVSAAMGVGAVWFWVSGKAKKRLSLIEEQLPDAIDLIVRGLRVGHPFVQALAAAAREIPDPLGSELGLIADEASYGRDMGEALLSFAERMDMQDLRFLAVAVTIQAQSGGNLAEILDGLSKVVRARFKLFRRVRAITAEAKWSGMFLSAFPIVAMLMISVVKPDYYDDVKETALFIPTALVVVAFLVINVLYMRKMVNIQV